jgi:hypothetical protein
MTESTKSSSTSSGYNIGHIQATNVVVGEAVVLAGTLGPFLTAFSTELGRRFGGTVADWASRIRLRRRRGEPTEVGLTITDDGAVTVLELDEGLSDEARLALIDLDIKADGVRGHRLKWDTQATAWTSAGKVS